MEPGCKAILDLSNKNCYPIANFDPAGLVFAIAYSESLGGHNLTKIALYDMEKYEEGCFANWKFDCPEIKILKFSNNGDYILCATAESHIFIIDSYQGQKISEISNYSNDNSIIESSFTPCSQFVISG
jgi:WD40 repeat protein